MAGNWAAGIAHLLAQVGDLVLWRVLVVLLDAVLDGARSRRVAQCAQRGLKVEARRRHACHHQRL